MPVCPFCGSDRVYPLLETLRCKRCKYIWKTGAENLGRSTTCGPDNTSQKTGKRSDPIKTRLEKKLDHYLKRSKGKFCLATMTWQAGDISQELFRRYVKQCVKDRTLEEEKDGNGRMWYFRP
ncbi:hypothetical protein [Methanoregula sp.]|uniref:hypothetical protein n=1 Tax=Methanoregula sp. TaxID=2052170 RepID=UPI003563DC74